MVGGAAMPVPDGESAPEKLVYQIFSQMDKNSDGRLSLQEFVDGAMNDPTIVQVLQCGPAAQEGELHFIP